MSAIASMFNQPVISHKANRIVVSGKNATVGAIPPLPDAAEREKVKQAVERVSNRKRYHDYYQRNKERLKERNKEYVERNREKIAAYNKEYREKNAAKVKALEKHWRMIRRQDPEYVAMKREQNRLYYHRKKHEQKIRQGEIGTSNPSPQELGGTTQRGSKPRTRITAPRLQAVETGNANVSATNV